MNLGSVNISEQQADLLDTELSTQQTVQEMCRLIVGSINDSEVMLAAQIAAAVLSQFVPSRQYLASCVWTWLKANVQFVTDEEQLWRLLGRRDELELLISPSVMVRARQKQGDCDCFTMLACSMLMCLGVPAVIKTFKCDRNEPWRWAHVCAAAVLEDGSTFPVDASHGEYPGWEVPASDVYESALWDMNGNRVTGGAQGMGRHRGLSGYVREPEWTGNEMTTVSGPVAGPYPSHDIMRYYYTGARAAGLQGIARAKYRGMGQVICIDTNPDGTCAEWGAGPSLAPGQTYNQSTNTIYDPMFGNTIDANTGAIISGPVLGSSSGGSSGGAAGSPINWASIIGSLSAAGTKLGAQALASPGTTIGPNGTIVTGSTAAQLAAASSSNYLLIGGLVIGAVLLVSMMKK